MKAIITWEKLRCALLPAAASWAAAGSAGCAGASGARVPRMSGELRVLLENIMREEHAPGFPVRPSAGCLNPQQAAVCRMSGSVCYEGIGDLIAAPGVFARVQVRPRVKRSQKM